VNLGRHSSIGEGSRHINGPEVEVGHFTTIAENVTFHGISNHPISKVSTFPMHLLGEAPNTAWGKGPIVIGNDVWIGDSVTILSGVKIGDGAIVGANAVITKDCKPYGVYAGNPARLKKYRLGSGTIKKLLCIKWWEWDDQTICGRINDFYNIKEFAQKYFVESE